MLETEIETDTGRAMLVDFMPPPADHVHADLVRLVIGLEGAVEFETEITLRFDYGRVIPWVRRLDHTGITAIAGPDAVILRSPIALTGRNFRTEARFTVLAGETARAGGWGWHLGDAGSGVWIGERAIREVRRACSNHRRN